MTTVTSREAMAFGGEERLINPELVLRRSGNQPSSSLIIQDAHRTPNHTAFLEDAAQMGLQARTRAFLDDNEIRILTLDVLTDPLGKPRRPLPKVSFLIPNQRYPTPS